MIYELGFGDTPQKVVIEDRNVMGVLLPNQIDIERRDEDAVEYALEHPVMAEPLEKLAAGKKDVVIITSDITRPVPSYQILPSVIERLHKAGIKNEEITIVLALGSHRKHTEAEKRKLAGGSVYRMISVKDSSDYDFVHMGTTRRGTPVDLCRKVAEADFKICLGNIEYHYFAGYSGGAKAIMPGVSTFEAIQANHKYMVNEKAVAGFLDGNPVREDIEEATAICGCDYIVNVVLDEHKKIVYATAGDVTGAHRAGCKFLDRLYRKELKQKADIVLVSQGGAPKDLNLYQTQKALVYGISAVQDGGTVILVGSCKEGLGQPVFESWIRGASNPDELVGRIQQDFQLGGHKAAAIALVLQKANIKLVSDMEDSLVKEIFMEPYHGVQRALDDALREQGEDAMVLLMPYGGSTLPCIIQENLDNE